MEHVLLLRARPDNRKMLVDLRAAMDSHSGPDHWLRRFRSAAWLIFVTEKELVRVGSSPRPDFQVQAGPSVREALIGTGLTTLRRPVRAKLRERSAVREAQLIGGGVFVMWVDNFNRQRYAKNPATTRNQSINGTAVAKLRVDVEPICWGGQPSLKEMYGNMKTIAGAIVAMHRWLRQLRQGPGIEEPGLRGRPRTL